MLLACAAFLTLLGCTAPQADPAPGVALAAAAPEARALWARLLAASGRPGRGPLASFQVQAEVRSRAGVQSVDATAVQYAYLAPDCIRFMLPSRNETGRHGPAEDQYWLRGKEGVVVLAGREYREDRKTVDDMLALARNYAALSAPERLVLLALERLAEAPADLGPELARAAAKQKLAWLALESPDFALVRGDPARRDAVYRVELGLEESGLPAIAIVRERGKPSTEPLLVRLARYQEQDGFRIPFELAVHVLDRALARPVFAATPSQQIYVTRAVLGPALTPADFHPR
jgi:hypothetical protein